MPSQLPLIANDSWLEPVAPVIEGRHQRYLDVLSDIEHAAGSLIDHAAGHQHFGLHFSKKEWTLREWAPGARSIHLVGDFNEWNNQSHPLTRDEYGVWSLTLPADTLAHGQK
ncbi:1,4-alpha-glucan-branching enzyme, partial [bacterium]|nr:1,4-alpha-glucan-branching enzyme [bacterium]